ncbi:MAG: hypothetical protein P8Z30_00805 [Acidobacteriota bacterium]
MTDRRQPEGQEYLLMTTTNLRNMISRAGDACAQALEKAAGPFPS